MREELSEAEIAERLELGLRRMPQHRRDLFLAAQRAGAAYETIAEQRGMSVSEVERHVAAAFVELHEALHDRAPRSSWRDLLRWIAAIIER